MVSARSKQMLGNLDMSYLKSPALNPELIDSLLESVASWDPRASVPLALTYMRVGEEAALKGFDAMALESPAAEEMLKERYLSPSPDVAHLASMPDGTLGKEFERYLTSNELDANLLRESAFIQAHQDRGEDVGYLAERGFQLHDLFHVLTGFDTTPLGEVRVVSFTVAQTPAPYPAMILASRPLQMVLYQPQLLPAVMDAITEGWALGRSAKPLMGVRWEDSWERPLEALRAEYDLA
jgi:ubiquinone biosynthesis protein Coq4